MDFTPVKEFMDHLTAWRIPGNAAIVYQDGKKVFSYQSGCADLEIVAAPVFADNFTYAFDKTRHSMILLKKLDRDRVFKGCFDTLKKGR